jgi:PRC-barrel domain
MLRNWNGGTVCEAPGGVSVAERQPGVYPMILKHALCLGTAVVCGLGLVEARSAQPPARPVAVDTKTTTPSSIPAFRRAKTVLGSTVSIQSNLFIGTVDDIIFNDDGYIEYLVVLNDGKMVAVPWQAAKFNFEKRVAVINITRDRFLEIPTFSGQAYPNFYEPSYRKNIYNYYGITPWLDKRTINRDRP